MALLKEQLLDLVARLHVAENELCPQLEDAEKKLDKVNKRYKRIKGKEPNLWLQGFVIALLIIIIMQGKTNEKPNEMLIAATLIATAAAVVLSTILAKIVYAMRCSRAEAWWNETGKDAALTINSAIERMRLSMYEYVAENPLLEQIPDYWWSEHDCKALYSLVLQNRASTLSEAISEYSSILEDLRRREREIEQHYRESEAQRAEQSRLDQIERDRNAALFALEDIRYHIKHRD